MSLVFVTHDLAVVGEVTDRILVMYEGDAVEQGTHGRCAAPPEHPYTEMLLSSAPGPDWQPERVAELRAAFAAQGGERSLLMTTDTIVLRRGATPLFASQLDPRLQLLPVRARDSVAGRRRWWSCSTGPAAPS